MKNPEGSARALGPWPAGANNLAAEHVVPGASLREAVNIMIDDTGRISRRDGYFLEHAATEPSGLFGYGPRGFFQEGTALYATELYANGALMPPMSVYEGLQSDALLAHCLIEPHIYLSDGQIALRIAADNTITPWSLPTAPAPALAVAPDGPLPAGRYQVALSYRIAGGEEGPLSVPTFIDASAGSAIVATFPAAPIAGSTTQVYMSKPNGTELLRYGTALSTTITLNKQPLGRPSPTQGLSPMPAGRFAAYYAGRLLVGDADIVYWSAPMHYGLTEIEYNYAMFSETVTGLGAAGENAAGFFVGQLSRTYFIAGADPADAQPQEVYPAGMVPGTLSHVPGARLPLENPPTMPVPVWLATNGVVCCGLIDGTVLPLTESRFAANVGDQGASVFVQEGGVNRLVVTTRNPDDNVFAVSDSVSMEIVRNGISP